jgi:hypothetical protein
MDVAGERQGDAARHRAVPRARSVREQDLERAGRREAQRGVQVRRLRIVRLPVLRIVDAEQRERRAVALDDVAAVLHEHLPGIQATASHRARAGIVVVVAEHRHDAERRAQVAKGAHVRRDVGRRDVDHVSRLQDHVRPQRVRLCHDLLHLVVAEVDAGVQVGEVQHREAVEARRQIGKRQRAARDLRQPVGAPDAVARDGGPGGGVGIRRAREELAPGQSDGWNVGKFEGDERVHPSHLPSFQPSDDPENRLERHIHHHQPAEHPPHELPRDERAGEGDPAHTPHRVEQHAVRDGEPGQVEEDEHAGEDGAAGGGGQAIPQIQIDQQLRRDEQEQVD